MFCFWNDEQYEQWTSANFVNSGIYIILEDILIRRIKQEFTFLILQKQMTFEHISRASPRALNGAGASEGSQTSNFAINALLGTIRVILSYLH